jgi:transcriptional regulator with XRE-family HTH domain
MPATRHAPKRSASAPLAAILRKKYAISQSLFARLLDVSVRTASALESGSVPAARAARRLTELQRLCQALAEVGKPTYIGTWLQIPNEMLAGLKPVEAIERGKIDLVWQVVEGLRSGSQS